MQHHASVNNHASAEDQGGIRPMFLLADSQLLFWNDERGPFLRRVREALGQGPLRAAYLGASNGDVPEYYDIFLAAMESMGSLECRMIPAEPSRDEVAFVDTAHLILLAGGDAVRGMRAFRQSGLHERIVARYASGAVLIGISAGAMQLGERVWNETGETFDGFRLAPMMVSVHDEPEWAALTREVTALEDGGRGLGIPFGGGAIVDADLTVEPVRKPLVEICAAAGNLKRSLLMPQG